MFSVCLLSLDECLICVRFWGPLLILYQWHNWQVCVWTQAHVLLQIPEGVSHRAAAGVVICCFRCYDREALRASRNSWTFVWTHQSQLILYLHSWNFCICFSHTHTHTQTLHGRLRWVKCGNVERFNYSLFILFLGVMMSLERGEKTCESCFQRSSCKWDYTSNDSIEFSNQPHIQIVAFLHTRTHYYGKLVAYVCLQIDHFKLVQTAKLVSRSY